MLREIKQISHSDENADSCYELTAAGKRILLKHVNIILTGLNLRQLDWAEHTAVESNL